MTGPGDSRPSAPLAAELLSLLERLRGVTERALDALRGGELSELPLLVESRAEILALAAPLLNELRLERQRGGGAPSPVADAVAEVARAGRALEAVERELLAGLGERRGALAAALRTSGRAAAAHVAYSRLASPTPPAR